MGAKRYIFFFTIFLPLVTFATHLDIKDQLTGEQLGKVHAFERNSQMLISLSDVLQILDIAYEFDLEKKQVLIERQGTLQIFALSPFLRLNGKVYQTALQPVFYREGLYLPAQSLSYLKKIGIQLDYIPDRHILEYPMRDANLTEIQFQSDSTETRIILESSRSFDPDQIKVDKSSDWLYFTIPGGIFEHRDNLTIEKPAEILECIPLQFTPKAARLSVKIEKNRQFQSVISPDSASLELIFSAQRPMILTQLEKEREKWLIDTIVIDPGHGGRDPGAVGPSALYEKNITLSIARAIKEELSRRSDVNVILTREGDQFMGLKNRTALANERGGKLFISIHVDANPVSRLRGHTIYFMGPAKTEAARRVAQFENSVIKFEESQQHYDGLSNTSIILAANAQNSYNKESQDLAAYIDEEMQEECDSKSLGVRQAGFYVLHGASMPNILVESGFITNRYDRQRLQNTGYHRRIAKAVTDGIIRFKQRYKSPALSAK